MRKNSDKKRNLWPVIYSILLTAYATFTLLDAFIIPRDIVFVEETGTSLPDLSVPVIMPEKVAIAKDNDIEETGTEETGTEETGTEETVIEADKTVYAESTENSYTSEKILITITAMERHRTQIYVADVVLKEAFGLRAGLAGNSFGRNVSRTTSQIAEESGAILAINGDFYGFRDSGFVMRNGYLYRDTVQKDVNCEDLVIYEDGRLEIIKESETDILELCESGAVQIFSFGPGLIQNGEITVDEESEVGKAMQSNPRTAIGQIEPLHYVFVVSDGRTEESAGLTLLELAEFMDELGCENAYNLDGGGSSTMWFMGKVVNYPTNGWRDGERSVSDIVYIGE